MTRQVQPFLATRTSTIMKRLLLAALVFTPMHSAAWSQERSRKDPVEWVDNTGKHRIEARFLRLDGDAVVLRRTDGRDLRIPFERLNADSVEQAKAMAIGKLPSKKSSDSNTAPNSSPAAGTTAPAAPASPGSSSSSPGLSGSFDNLDAKAFVDKMFKELDNNNVAILWDVLPSKKQKDIEDLVVAFSKRLDSRTFDMLRKTRNTILEIARKQQPFILNSAVLNIPSESKEKLQRSYPEIVGLVDSYIAKDLFDGKRLQKGDLRGLIDQWSKNIVESAEQFGKTLPEGDPFRAQILNATKTKYTVESASSDSATLKIETPSLNGPPTTTVLNLKKSDGRWLPREMVDGWEFSMAMAKGAVENIKGEEVHQQVSLLLLGLNAPLQNLKNAKTQEEFDKQLTELQSTMQSSAMATMPPGAGPPTGGFPGAPGGLPPQGGAPPSPGSQPPPAGGSNNGSSSSDQ